MTRETEQAVRLLVNRHGSFVRQSLVEHLKRVIPIPALHKALKSWDRRPEAASLEAVVAKIMDALYEPVTVTRSVQRGGEELDLVTLSGAAPRLGVTARTLSDLRSVHTMFPAPFLETALGCLWVFEDIESFYRAYRPEGGRRAANRTTKREKEKET